MSQDVKIPTCKCERCGYTWYLRYPQKPRVCPNCKSPYWDSSSEYKVELELDAKKAQEITDELSIKVQKAKNDPATWAIILKSGWQRMLETSELPVKNVDRLFSEGFSIQDWFISVKKIADGLAKSIVEHFKLASYTDDSQKELFEKARRLLEWDEVLANLSEETTKVLGLLWFAEKQSTGITYPDTEVKIQEKVWGLLEGAIGKRKGQLLDEAQTTIDIIENASAGITSWPDVIRFP